MRCRMLPLVRYTAKCPHCGSKMTVMSSIAPTHPMSVPPDQGDGISCDDCHKMSIVRSIEGERVIVIAVTAGRA